MPRSGSATVQVVWLSSRATARTKHKVPGGLSSDALVRASHGGNAPYGAAYPLGVSLPPSLFHHVPGTGRLLTSMPLSHGM